MNTNSELRELNDEELNAVQGGMSCCNGIHYNEATISARGETDWVALARSYLGL